MANNTGKKHGGRVKGTPNKISAELKTVLSEVIEKEVEKLPSYLLQLPIKDRLEVVAKLLPYVLPKAENYPNELHVIHSQKTLENVRNLTDKELEKEIEKMGKNQPKNEY